MSNIPPRSTLLTIYYSLVRSYLECDDTVYSQQGNDSLSNKIETVQYNASSPVIAGLVRGTFQKLYQELGLESFNSRRWLRCICYFYKTNTTQRPASLLNLIFQKFKSFRHPDNYSLMRCRINYER